MLFVVFVEAVVIVVVVVVDNKLSIAEKYLLLYLLP